MIIYELEEKSHKELFVQIGTILAVTKNESNNNRLLKFAEQYNLKNNLINELSTTKWMKFYSKASYSNLLRRSTRFESTISAMGFMREDKKNDSNDSSFNLSHIFKDSCKQIFDEYASVPSFKSEILNKLLSKEGNVSNITTDIMINVMLELPKARQLVLNKMIDIVMIKNNKLIETLSYDVKKIILFNLFFILLEENEISEEHVIMLKNVCKKLQIDNEYIEEFNLLVTKFDRVLSELDELITE